MGERKCQQEDASNSAPDVRPFPAFRKAFSVLTCDTLEYSPIFKISKETLQPSLLYLISISSTLIRKKAWVLFSNRDCLLGHREHAPLFSLLCEVTQQLATPNLKGPGIRLLMLLIFSPSLYLLCPGPTSIIAAFLSSFSPLHLLCQQSKILGLSSQTVEVA